MKRKLLSGALALVMLAGCTAPVPDTQKLPDDGGEETRQDLLEIRPDEKERDYMEQLVAGVQEHAADIDAEVSKYAVGWKIERISRVDLAIMRLALYEIKYASQPAGVAVNEALELAKAYSTPEAVPFVNGVLGSFVRSRT